MAATNAQEAIDVLFTSVGDGKAAVASAITDKGVETKPDATFQFMAQNISKIKTGIDTGDATATEAAVRTGYTFYAGGLKKTGTLATVTQATPAISISPSGLITASATQLSGYVPAGEKSATSQLTTQGATTFTPTTGNQTVLAGRYLTGPLTILGDANLVAENIKSGTSIFGVAGNLRSVDRTVGDGTSIVSASRITASPWGGVSGKTFIGAQMSLINSTGRLCGVLSISPFNSLDDYILIYANTVTASFITDIQYNGMHVSGANLIIDLPSSVNLSGYVTQYEIYLYLQ